MSWNQNQLLRTIVPLLLLVCLVLVLFRYSSIQTSIDNETSELVRLDNDLLSRPAPPAPPPQGASGPNWVRQLLLDAEEVWLESKNKRVAALEELGPSFREQPWGQVSYTIFWDFFTPSYHCPRPVERVGRVGDGGKWVCGFSHVARQKKDCVVYSYGVSDEITFEKEILERSACRVRMYDYTINTTVGKPADLVAQYSERAKLYRIGLGEKDGGDLLTLKSAMEKEGDEFIDILKVDIEGAEFNVMKSILKEFHHGLPFAQLQIELHLMNLHGGALDYFSKWFDELEDAGLRAFFSEPNEVALVLLNKNHVDYIEYSFLNSRIDPDYFYV